MLVSLDGLKQPVKLIVGNYNGAGGGGTFVRRDGEAQSLLVKGNLTRRQDRGRLGKARPRRYRCQSPEAGHV